MDGDGEPLDEDLVATAEPDRAASRPGSRVRRRAPPRSGPDPVVSLPSDRSTIRFWASSGKSAAARRSAAPMSVADRTGVEAIRSISAQVGREPLHERVSAERDDAGDVLVLPSRQARRARTRATPRARRPRRSPRGRRRTPSRAGRRAGRAGTRRARTRAPTAARSGRRAPPAVARAPSRRRAARCRTTTTASSTGEQQEREGRVEGDAHQAFRRGRRLRPPEPGRERAAQARERSRS